jgi:hypothetical protein
VRVNGHWGPTECSPSFSDRPPPLSDTARLASPRPFPSPVQIRLPRFPERLGDRVWLPECPEVGISWRETRICVSSSLAQAVHLQLPGWIHTVSKICQMGRDP